MRKVKVTYGTQRNTFVTTVLFGAGYDDIDNNDLKDMAIGQIMVREMNGKGRYFKVYEVTVEE